MSLLEAKPSDTDNSEGWLLQAITKNTGRQKGDGLRSFTPLAPKSFEETGLTAPMVEGLILKFMWNRGGVARGQQIADQLGIPFSVIEGEMRRLKEDRLVGHKRSAGLTDYEYEITGEGAKIAKRYDEQGSYHGSAPVPFREYQQAIAAQSLSHLRPSIEALRGALSDLAVNDHMLSKIGQALTAGKSLFLFGQPGNGKTSIAERVTGAFGKHIWIPKAIAFGDDIVRLFDPIVHTRVSSDTESGGERLDARWIQIERPTIIVGGELTLDQLEVAFNKQMGVSEAPVQLKSNCGTLVIDDFGRQRMRPDELLNRWIVPLEKRYDFLNLPSGKKIQVPFDQMLIFSTNLEPREIVDEAFLRRIPYKIEALSPDEQQFREVYQAMAASLEIPMDDAAFDHMIDKYYRATGREFRYCHPRDLLLQVRNYCEFHELPIEMKTDYLDQAAENYFSIMG